MSKTNKKPTIENVSQLRYQLTELWDKVMEDEIDTKKAKVLSAIAQNILKSVSVQDTHAQINGLVNKIDFMEVESTMKKRQKGIANDVFIGN